MPNPQVAFNAPPDLAEQLASRTPLGHTLGSTARNDLVRYYALLDMLPQPEWLVGRAADVCIVEPMPTPRHIQDLDRSAARYGEPTNVVDQMHALSFAEKLSLVDAAERLLVGRIRDLSED